MRHEILEGDCLKIMPTMDPESIDSLVTDPPAGIGFMGKDWDNHSTYEPSTDKGRAVLEAATVMGLERWEAGFVSFTTDWATEAMRVLKPGAHGLVWAIPRTADLTGMGLRAAGFEVRDTVTHIFGAGFPKSLDVSKAIDLHIFGEWVKKHRPKARRFTKRLWQSTPKDRWAWLWIVGVTLRHGAPNGKRFVVGTREQRNPYIGSDGLQFKDAPDYTGQEEQITVAGSEEAKRWEGWGTALKPASECWILTRKPMSEDTVARNVLAHGVGAINVDGCRIATGETLTGGGGKLWSHERDGTGDQAEKPQVNTDGRWPSNILFTHHPDCKRVGTKRVQSDRHDPAERGAGGLGTAGHKGQTGLEEQRLTEETVDAWECAEGCPVRILDEQSGELKSGVMKAGTKRANTMGYAGSMPDQTLRDTIADSGGASRFFPQFAWDEEDLNTALFLYCAKASRSERNAGCDQLEEKDLNWSSGTKNPGSFQAPGTKRKAKNPHPTVKPKALMRWLLRLITPPGGTALDPFAGSGSTIKAAAEEGFSCIGIERDPQYTKVAKARTEGEQLRFDLLLAASSD